MRGYSPTARAYGLGTTVSVAFPFVTEAASKGATSAVLGAFGGPIGLAITGATTAIGYFLSKWKQRAQQKVYTTQIVNEAEPLLQQNLAAWGNSGKTQSEQLQAIANFNAVWREVVRQCSTSELGKPGKWCIEDRQRGGEWDWFRRYLDPIEQDPDVRPDPTFAESILPGSLADVFSAGSSGGRNLLLLVGGAVLLLFGATRLVGD